MQEKTFWVYIMTNRSKTLYVGVTSRLQGRVWDHKNHVFAGFTDRYHVDRLVWYEIYSTASRAIAREKQLKDEPRLEGLVGRLGKTIRGPAG